MFGLPSVEEIITYAFLFCIAKELIFNLIKFSFKYTIGKLLGFGAQIAKSTGKFTWDQIVKFAKSVKDNKELKECNRLAEIQQNGGDLKSIDIYKIIEELHNAAQDEEGRKLIDALSEYIKNNQKK